MWDVMIKKLFELVFQTWPPSTFNPDVIKFAGFFEGVPNPSKLIPLFGLYSLLDEYGVDQNWIEQTVCPQYHNRM